jgi:ABC-type Fe3+-hydroxamate transport system substrate-binding protein
MALYTDQMKRVIELPNLPQRIISLVPSQTELLFDLGLRDEVIGITKFCVHPKEWFRNKTRIGGTKNVNTTLAASLQPDLIIANKEENTKEQIEALESIAPVWISDINNVKDAFSMIESIGDITGRSNEAAKLITRIKKEFAQFSQSIHAGNKIYRTAYLIWKDPYMTVGGNTFINDIMRMAGLKNVFIGSLRYPEITLAEIKEKETELILLSSEPFPFKQKHIDELKLALPQSTILLADGEIFSWYGSRMLQAATYFEGLRKQLHA